MQELVGIIRTETELDQALDELDALHERALKLSVSGGRACTTRAGTWPPTSPPCSPSRVWWPPAPRTKESRGGHTREDYPEPDPELGKVNLVQRIDAGGNYSSSPTALPEMPAELKELVRGGPALMADADDAGLARRRRRGRLRDYVMPAEEGEVVLDVIHRIQAGPAPDLACRWNCKAGKCGSCSAEINGLPKLMCMTRMDVLPEGEPVMVAPMRTFPIIRDLVTDVSFNYTMARQVPPFKPREPEADGTYRMQQIDIERGQEFRKCIECFMCQDVCHVIRDHEDNKATYAGPRMFIRIMELESHPLDTDDRRSCCASAWGSACATSPSAAPRCVPSTSRSPTTPSSP